MLGIFIMIVVVVLIFGILGAVFDGSDDSNISYNQRRCRRRGSNLYKKSFGKYLSEVRGIDGERNVVNTIKWTMSNIENCEYRILNNVYIPKEDGTTSEIDILLINQSGIHVIESKNYSGWIFGNENNEKWVQTLPKRVGGAEKNFFYNPIRQNRGHIYVLRNFIGYNYNLHYYSYVVFGDDAELKDVTLNSDANVINRHSLSSVLQKNTEGKQMLSAEKINDIYEKLLPCTNVSVEEKDAHILNIKENEKKMQDAVKCNICPRCGKSLVIRTNRTSGNKFYGCEGYPKCTYTKKYDETNAA